MIRSYINARETGQSRCIKTSAVLSASRDAPNDDSQREYIFKKLPVKKIPYREYVV